MPDEPLLQMTLGDIDLDPLPPRDAVTFSGGGRAVSERVALDGSLIVRQAQGRGSRRVTVTAPAGFVIRAEQADAIFALARSGARFTLTLRGYTLTGTYTGCMFGEADLPQFEPTADPRYKRYSFTVYLP